MRHGGVEAAGHRVFDHRPVRIGKERADFEGGFPAGGMGPDHPDFDAAWMAAGRLDGKHGRSQVQHDAEPAGSVIDPFGIHNGRATNAKKGSGLDDGRLLGGAGAEQRRCREGQPVRVSADRHQPDPAFLHHDTRLSGHTAAGQPGVACAERRMAGKGQLPVQGEDANAIIGLGSCRGQQEGRLREVQPTGDPLHGLGVQPLGLGDDGQRIAGEILAAEDVHELEGSGHHIPLKHGWLNKPAPTLYEASSYGGQIDQEDGMDERLQRTIAALRGSDADWAILSGADSISYALGYAPTVEIGLSPFAAGSMLGIVGSDGAAGILAMQGEATTPRDGIILRYEGYGSSQSAPASAAYADALTTLIKRLGVGGRIAIEPATHPQAAEQWLAAGERIDLTPGLRRQRMTKTAAEIQALHRCASIAAAGQWRLLEALTAGITELELFSEIRSAMESAAGARIAVGGDLVSGRERTAAIGGWPNTRRIEIGDAVISDLGPRVEGYWGDSCATVVLGPATDEQARLFHAAKEALDYAISEIRPGMTAETVHRKVLGMVQGAGFDYPHHTGHGIGASVHEHPRLCEGEQTVLRAGMVLMVEPGAYDPAIGGARTEWMLHLTETGCVPLSPFPLQLSVAG